ncbi:MULTISPECIES: hypothetical protein [unclassified Nonomuraea]|uniref:hypothetical protein n=1 Tax=unclassified Nonomuraea TaxID=2593643 RepID=UPI0035C0B112
MDVIFGRRKAPEPIVDGNTISYRDAVAKGADLVLTARPNGFTQDVVLRARPQGLVKVSLPVTLPESETPQHQGRECCRPQAIGWFVAHPWDLTAQDRVLVPEHQQVRLRRDLAPRVSRSPTWGAPDPTW